MLMRWEAAVWAALYEGDNGPLRDARREIMAKINEPFREPIMETDSVTATSHPWAQSWNPITDPVREA